MFGAIKLKLYGLIAALFAGLIAVIYAAGRKDGGAKKDRQDAKEYKETTERISEARPVDSDPVAARNRLRDRNKR